MQQLDIFENSIFIQEQDSNDKDRLTVIENGEYVFYQNFFTKSDQ